MRSEASSSSGILFTRSKLTAAFLALFLLLHFPHLPSLRSVNTDRRLSSFVRRLTPYSPVKGKPHTRGRSPRKRQLWRSVFSKLFYGIGCPSMSVNWSARRDG